MWDSFLIFLAKHPFIVSIILVVLAAIFLYFGRKALKYQMLSTIILITGIGIGYVLHFRWDSFSIHFLDQNLTNFREKDILFIGDSITCEGIKPRGFITKFSSVILSKNIVICEKGAITSIIAKNVKTSDINYEPDYIIFQSGINDFLKGHPHKKTLTEQRDLETEIKKKFPGSIAYFLPIHPLSLNQQQTKDLPNIPSVLANVWNGFEKSFLEKDGIHLNAKGHTFLTKNLLKELSKYM